MSTPRARAEQNALANAAARHRDAVAARREQTVKDVIDRLRTVLRHVGRRDREAVSDGIEAIFELSTRLHEATHVATVATHVTGPQAPPPFTLTYVPDETAPADGADVLDVTRADSLPAPVAVSLEAIVAANAEPATAVVCPRCEEPLRELLPNTRLCRTCYTAALVAADVADRQRGLA